MLPIRVVTHARSMHRRRTLAPNGYNSGLGFAHPDPRRQADAKAMGALQSGLKLTCIGTFHGSESGHVACGEFLRFLTAASPATIDAYRRDLEGFINWSEDRGCPDPLAVGRSEVRGWVAKMSGDGYAPRTIARRLSTLRRYFGWLHRSGLIKLDPTAYISAPKGDARLPRVLQRKEIDRLFDETTPKNSLE